eukprot:TRINITY_DN20926_c0_g1_i1.p1 TRINITY_DN20926_c0_g1~~TRINITY_DN20926_c0_g1_i1.p1  ORF type:complete len:328 (+),score=28.92 TRINITY_DN20926_c0_g1_i1:47-1030(+)
MGRRHFDFAPGLRAVSNSLCEGCVVSDNLPRDSAPRYGELGRRSVNPPSPAKAHEATLYGEPPAWSPGKRMFPQSQELYSRSSSTSSASGRRPCTAPSVRDDKTPSTRRHYSKTMHLETSLAEVAATEPSAGRRHVPAPQGHMSATVGRVVRDDARSSSRGRRRCQRASSASASEARRGGGVLPAQRRHLVREDHVVGPLLTADSEPAHRRSRRPASQPAGTRGGAMAQCLKGEAAGGISAGDAERCRAMRRIQVQDNLFGGLISGAPPAPDDPRGGAQRRPSPRRPRAGPNDHLMGGHVRRSSRSDAGTVLQPRAPPDELIGGVLR